MEIGSAQPEIQGLNHLSNIRFGFCSSLLNKCAQRQIPFHSLQGCPEEVRSEEVFNTE